MKKMLGEFKDFAVRGNVVDLAVAVVIGAAFGAVVKSFTDDILMQIVAAVFGTPDFSSKFFTINDAQIRYGSFINAVIAFVLVALALFFVVKALNALSRKKADEPEAPSDEVVLLTEIRDALRTRG